MQLSKERLQGLIAHSPDIVVATESKGRSKGIVVYYNDGASKILGYKPEEIIGRFVGQLYPTIDEAKRVMNAMRDAGQGGKGIVETFQTTYLSKTGERIPVAISGGLTYDDEGNPDGTIGFAKDLRELLRKDQLATLGEVAIGLSHEINNPLSVILNQLELLEWEVGALAGDADASVELERIDAVRREVGRVSDIMARLTEMVETESYETVEYVGPARMIDLSGRRTKPTADPRLKGVRVLVADDDMGICRTLEEMLTAAGCVVETAPDGAQALRRCEASTFDLVLTDVVMPNMDGYELYTALKERSPELPVLMMTAFHYDKDHIIKRSKLEGLEGVIFKKPVDPERLREVVAATVSEKREAR